MAYRGETTCGVCGAATIAVCPRCGRGVCREHTLLALLEGRSAGEARAGQRLARRLGGPGVCADCVAQELEASRGPFVELLRSSDPLQVQMISESLLDAGFDARALGTSGAALIGAAPQIFEQRIEVPASQAAAARELVEALLGAGEPAEDAPAGERPEAEAAPPAGGARRTRRVVIGLVLGAILAAIGWLATLR